MGGRHRTVVEDSQMKTFGKSHSLDMGVQWWTVLNRFPKAKVTGSTPVGSTKKPLQINWFVGVIYLIDVRLNPKTPPQVFSSHTLAPFAWVTVLECRIGISSTLIEACSTVMALPPAGDSWVG
jgi:hypothetical protein